MELKFSQRLKDVVTNSRLECIRLGYDEISAEMLVLGMIRNAKKPTTPIINGAVLSLSDMHIDESKLEKFLLDKIEKISKKVDVAPIGNITLSKPAELILKKSHQMAIRFGERGSIDTIHLLAAFLEALDLTEKNDYEQSIGLNMALLKANIIFDDLNGTDTDSVEKVDDQLVRSRENIERLKDLSKKLRELNLDSEKEPATKPLSMVFDMEEYSVEEIKEIIGLVARLYHTQSGDHLVIKGMSQFETVQYLECV
ncbi:hypothetical protein [Pedobacter sp. GR22-10]|uniref:hypothetical protein n=1 Tax=Pedobacter sp. GR22-10 TaxID=2994472 RepID=UPI002246B6C0|nr:hypothetical protein [Pedobacter sp. GR22-10]MCX2432195.1 hypothetical protein [Pedobacter sp. GR22-10]